MKNVSKSYLVILVLILTSQFGFGQIGFEEKVIVDNTYSTDGATATFAIDIDGDGDVDLLSASANDYKIGWYENIDGLGSFGKQKAISTNANRASDVSAADIDNDGDIDVISASRNDDKIAWYENIDGLGTFSSEKLISTLADGAESIFAADIDNDNDLDIISASSNDDKIAWYENLDGQGNFSSEILISTSVGGVKSVFAADIDNDGDVDVISGSYDDNNLVWFENMDGLGGFSPEITIANASGVSDIFAADLDNDGDTDIVSANRNSSILFWYENIDGLGSFSSNNAGGFSGAVSVDAADLDNDGDLDIFVSSYFNDLISWFENTDGQGNYVFNQTITTLVNTPSSVISSDINNDGNMDIISASFSDDKIAWFRNSDGLGNFDRIKVVSANIDEATSVYSVDIDGDGDMDALSSSKIDSRIAWYENLDGLGSFSNIKEIAIDAGGAHSVHAVDLDGDGDIDVLSASEDNDKIVWYENLDGLGDFSSELIISSDADAARSVYAADLDNDGDQDVLYGSYNDDIVAWHENINGQGTFGTRQIISNDANGPNHIYAADINNDGHIDVLSASNIDGKIAWYENINGQGSFGPQQVIIALSTASSVFASDIDGDNDLDVLSTNSGSSSYVVWYENDGQGNFINFNIITATDNPSSVYTTDLDNDGDQDVVTASRFNSNIAWHENIDGLGSFGAKQIISDNVDYGRDVFAADLDNDGDIDVLSASTDDNKIAWYENLGVLGNEISGTVTYDVNSNGCDVDDIPAIDILVSSTNGSNDFASFSQLNGSFQIALNEGNFITQIQNIPNYYSSNPISVNSNFVGLGNTESIDFCLLPTSILDDLNISIIPPADEPRPGFDTSYQIIFNNIGTTQLSGDVTFQFDDSKIQFLNASESIASQTANTLTFDYTNLNPFETRTIDLDFNVFPPPTTNIDDELITTVSISPTAGDETQNDNTFTLEQTVIGSYDPNDIQILEGEQVHIDDADEYLHFLIRFQNTGTASAINVRVEHILDSKLDWTTMQLQSLSHDGRVEITDGSDVQFIFNNINLPAQTTDEEGSIGYIAFKIEPKDTVVLGDIISGVADIYFDFNPPIITNTATTEFVDNLGSDDFSLNEISVYPNPTDGLLNIQSNSVIDRVEVFDMLGRKILTRENDGLTAEIDLSLLKDDIYFIKISSGSTFTTEKIIKN